MALAVAPIPRFQYLKASDSQKSSESWSYRYTGAVHLRRFAAVVIVYAA